MGAIADLAVPGGGAIAALPAPGAVTTPQALDTYGTQSSGSVYRGLRSSFTSLGASVDNLLGTLAEPLGLTDFAARRFAEADLSTRQADLENTPTRDYRDVTDMTSLVDYVGGLLGQGLGSAVPALGGAAAGLAAPAVARGVVGGVRGAVSTPGGLLSRTGGAAAGAARGVASGPSSVDAATRAALGLGAGSFVPNAGEQAGNLRSVDATPGQKLANTLGVGAVNTGLDVATGGEARVVRGVLKPSAKGAIKEVGKTALSEGLTEGLQDVVSQGGVMALDPGKHLDPHSVVNNALGGVVGGAGIGAIGRVAGAAPGAAADGIEAFRARFGRQPDVVDSEDPEHLAKIASDPAHKTPEDLLAAIDAGEEESKGSVSEAYRRGSEYFKSKLGDFDFERAKADGGELWERVKATAKDFVRETRDRPEVQRAFEHARSAGDYAKGFYDAATGREKKSLMRNKEDYDIHDAVVGMLPSRTRANLDPAQLMELTDSVKHAVRYALGRRAEEAGPQKPAHSLADDPADVTRREQDRPTKLVPVEDAVPASVLHLLGSQAGPIFSKVEAMLGASSTQRTPARPSKGVAGPLLQGAIRRTRARRTAVETAVLKHLRPEYASDKATREYVTENFIRMLNHPTADVMEAAGHLFEDRPGAMRAVEAALENSGLAHEYGLSKEDLAQFDEALAENPVDDEGRPVPRGDGRDPIHDARLNTRYDSIEAARQAARSLEADYDKTKVQFRARSEMEYDPESGVDQPTGRILIEAVDRAASTGFTGEPSVERNGAHTGGSGQWGRITDKNPSKQAGFEHGTIGVQLKGGQKVRVSLRALTAEASRTYERDGAGRLPYPHDVVMHGLSQLLSDERVESVAEKFGKDGKPLGAEQWNLPDDAPVGVVNGRQYTWGQIQAMTKMSPRQLNMRMLRENTVEMAEQAESLDEIREEIWPDLQKRVGEFTDEYDAAEATVQKLQKRRAPKDLLEPAEKARDMARAALRGILGVQSKVLQERDRRLKHGDAPKMEIGTNNVDRQMLEGEQQEAVGPRNVQEETGASLHGEDRPRGSGFAAHEVGLNEGDRAHGPTTSFFFGEDMPYIASSGTDSKGRPRILINMDKARAEYEAGFPYFLGKEGSPGSRQKGAVAKELKLTADKLKELFPTPKAFVAFLKAHEESHLANKDHEAYPRAPGGRPDLESPRALAIEVRATKDALPAPKKSAIPASGAALTDEQKAEVRAYVERVLGKDKARVAFKNLAEAGNFRIDESGVEQLRIANLALDPLGAARHEAAHALFARLMKSDKATAQQLMAAAGSAPVVSRLRALLKGHPEALKQLEAPEERVAYMYQFWAGGALDVGPKTKGIFAQVKRFFKAVAGIWSESFTDERNVDRAYQVFNLFDRGDLSDRNTVAEVLRAKAPGAAFPRAAEALAPVWDGVKKMLYTSDGLVRSMNIPAFNEVADKFFAPLDRAAVGPGYNQAKHPARNKFMTQLTDALRGLDEAGQRRLLEDLQAGAASGPHADKVRRLLGDVFAYMQGKGVKAVVWNGKEYEEHDLRAVADYFPRSYDREYVLENRKAFEDMLRRNGLSAGEAHDATENILRSGPATPGESDDQVGLTYFAPNTQARKLNVPAAELAPFLRKDLFGTLSTYINYAARRAEYTERFGNQGEKIQQAITRAVKEQGATVEQVNTFSKAVQAWEGSLGHDIKPGLKGIFGAVTTYQNVRLLPLALFSSLVDPMGLMVRGGTVADAFSGFARGVQGMFKESRDDTYDMALAVGTIADSVEDHMLAEAYGSNYMPDALRYVNDKFFQWNGMESWNRQMRVAATGAGASFLIRHAKHPTEHSERYLAELGLTAADVVVKDGRLDTSSQKVRDALNQWVDGAVLRPNASIRPVWMSDPHWMLVSHLKQYTYSFQKTIIARVAHEARHGNYTPALALASYVPMIIAADVIRAVMTPGGGDDDNLKKLTLAGVVGRGIQRAGLVGPGQYALDAYGDLGHDRIPMSSFGGPTFQQLVELGGSVASPRGDTAHELVKALPGYVLLK